MAKTSVRKDLHSPCLARVIAATTAAVLHSTAAPASAQHLPCGVMFHGAGNFVWIDSSGTTVTTVVTAESVGIYCPIAPTELDATNAVAVTVFWQPEP